MKEYDKGIDRHKLNIMSPTASCLSLSCAHSTTGLPYLPLHWDSDWHHPPRLPVITHCLSLISVALLCFTCLQAGNYLGIVKSNNILGHRFPKDISVIIVVCSKRMGPSVHSLRCSISIIRFQSKNISGCPYTVSLCSVLMEGQLMSL
jgi:hypothetical protein